LANGGDVLTQGGHGGRWLTGSKGQAERIFHYRNGRWTSTPVPTEKGSSTALSLITWIPRTRSVWGGGSIGPVPDNFGTSQAVILKYGF
jgi:hypothetical protein